VLIFTSMIVFFFYDVSSDEWHGMCLMKEDLVYPLSVSRTPISCVRL
jgi:hypothetical protein